MVQAFSRRVALGALGATGAVGVGMLTSSAAAATASTPAAASSAFSVADWVAGRPRPYFIGHRGSGDVYPEHSLEAYRGAAALGAPCVEVSVNITSDGLLVCMHDPTYDRTTNVTGPIASQPSTILRSVFLDVPALGPAWLAVPQVRVPTLRTVLQELGGSVVLALEAKNDRAYPAVMAMVAEFGLEKSVLAKLAFASTRFAQAKSAGYPIFGYIGSESDLTTANISTLYSKLDANSDYMVIPAYGTGGKNGYVADSLVNAAVGTGVPVWVFGVHRRSDVTHFAKLGVQGFVASSYGYVSTDVATATADTWSSGAVAPGEMTKSPGSTGYAPTWGPGQGELTLAAKGVESFVTMGHFGPLRSAAATYSISCEVSWTTYPSDNSNNLTIAFGHTDDAYYEHRGGAGTGYHAILRADGRLGLYSHKDGVPDGHVLQEIATTAPPQGQWVALRIDVTPTTLTLTRTDTGASVKGTDATVRGGYIHIGRSSTDGVGAFRKLKVS